MYYVTVYCLRKSPRRKYSIVKYYPIFIEGNRVYRKDVTITCYAITYSLSNEKNFDITSYEYEQLNMSCLQTFKLYNSCYSLCIYMYMYIHT